MDTIKIIIKYNWLKINYYKKRLIWKKTNMINYNNYTRITSRKCYRLLAKLRASRSQRTRFRISGTDLNSLKRKTRLRSISLDFVKNLIKEFIS